MFELAQTGESRREERPPEESRREAGAHRATDRRDSTTGWRDSATDRTRADGRGATPYVVLYARGSAVGHDHDREARVLDALKSLNANGALDGFDVRTWPSTVSLRTTGTPQGDVVDDFQRFQTWADANGVRIRPPFVVRHRHSAITQERDEVLVTPTLFLTVWDGDDLVAAYPHSHDEGVRTIEDGIVSFFEDRLRESESESESVAEAVDLPEPEGRR